MYRTHETAVEGGLRRVRSPYGTILRGWDRIVDDGLAVPDLDLSLGDAGGLVGENASGGTVTASYSTGTATGDSQAGRSEEKTGELVGRGGGTVTNSYWDAATSGHSTSAGGTSKTTSELQTPTGYTGIYASWNVNVDGVTGSDPGPVRDGRGNQREACRGGQGHRLGLEPADRAPARTHGCTTTRTICAAYCRAPARRPRSPPAV